MCQGEQPGIVFDLEEFGLPNQLGCVECSRPHSRTRTPNYNMALSKSFPATEYVKATIRGEATTGEHAVFQPPQHQTRSQRFCHHQQFRRLAADPASSKSAMVKVMVVRLLRSGPGRGDSGRIHYFQREAPWPSLSPGWNPTGRIYSALWRIFRIQKNESWLRLRGGVSLRQIGATVLGYERRLRSGNSGMCSLCGFPIAQDRFAGTTRYLGMWTIQSLAQEEARMHASKCELRRPCGDWLRWNGRLCPARGRKLTWNCPPVIKATANRRIQARADPLLPNQRALRRFLLGPRQEAAVPIWGRFPPAVVEHLGALLKHCSIQ